MASETVNDSLVNQITKYVLLKIHSEEWAPGTKILSRQQMEIKFDASISNVKMAIRKLKEGGYIVSKERQGLFVNPDFYMSLPFSVRKRYKSIDGGRVERIDKSSMKKIFTAKGEVIVEVLTKMSTSNELADNILSNIDVDKTFLWNLSHAGVSIFDISVEYKVVDRDGQSFIRERRKLYDLEDKLVVSEDVFVRTDVWSLSINRKK